VSVSRLGLNEARLAGLLGLIETIRDEVRTLAG